MDVKIKESGKWKGKAKLSKRGSGLLRQMLALFRLAEYSFRGFRLWGILSSFGGTRTQENICCDGCHAQDGDSRDSFDTNWGGLRFQQSLGGDSRLEGAPSSLLSPPRSGHAEVSHSRWGGLGRALCAFKPSVTFGRLDKFYGFC
jgi:hypothetical protein